MTNYTTRDFNQSQPTRLFALGPAATKVVVLVFFAVLLLLYLAQSTQGATRQYEIRNREDELTTLKQDREQLELEAVRLRSLREVSPTPEAPADQAADGLKPAEHLNALPTATKVVSR